MRFRRSLAFLVVVGMTVLVLNAGLCHAADAASPPALSTLVPVEDLTAEIESYVEDLEECVEDAVEYEDSLGKIEKRSNTLAVIALTVGMHDKPSKYQKAAPALIKASQEVASAKDYAAARAGVAKLKAALSAKGDPSTLKWVKVASLHALMEQVPLLNTNLKRYMRRFERGAERIPGPAAAIVAISQGSMANADETEAPDKVAEWYKYCVQMRDSASALNQAARAEDEDAAEVAMKALQQSCEDCHAVFHADAE